MQFYDFSTPNGKMKQEAYINQILEPVVKPWLEAGHGFVLEEDKDSGVTLQAEFRLLVTS